MCLPWRRDLVEVEWKDNPRSTRIGRAAAEGTKETTVAKKRKYSSFRVNLLELISFTMCL